MRHLVLVSLVVASIALTGGTLIQMHDPVYAQGADDTAAEAAPGTATTSPDTASPLSSPLNGIKNFLLDILFLGALLIAVFLVPMIVWRLIRLMFLSRELVVEKFVNSSGSDDLGKSVAGLSQMAREELSHQLLEIRREVTENCNEGGQNSYHLFRRAPLKPYVAQALSGDLNALLDSLKDVAPDNVKGVIELLKVAFPPRGKRINGDLQRWDDKSNKLGLTLSVADIDNQHEPIYQTLWEASRGTSRAASKETSKETSEETLREAPRSTPTETSEESSKETTNETTKDASSETSKDISKDNTKKTTKEISGDTSKNVSTSKETTKESSSEQRDLTRGYIQLLKPACRWLAYEVSERDQLAGILKIPVGPRTQPRWPGESRAREHAREIKRNALAGTIHNFYGLLYTTSAPTYEGHTVFFYRQAVDEYKKAIDLFTDAPTQIRELSEYGYGDQEKENIVGLLRRSYLPYENLANTYSFLGRALIEDENQQDVFLPSNTEYQRESLLMYRRAQQRAAMLTLDSELRQNVERRILLGRATTSLLTGDPVLIEEARQQIADLVQRWNLDDEREALTLYNLACWYAVADNPEVVVDDGASGRARRYLAYSLGRDERRDLWNWVDKDPDVANLGARFIDRLKFQLIRARLQQPDLHSAPGDYFGAMMDSIIEATSANPEPS